MNTLVIVESPYKVPTIKGYLGKGYKIVASVGHVRDLPKSKLGVDVDNDFAPEYINIRGKGDLIASLKKEAKRADVILLATDPDREGEAISWHLSIALGAGAEKVRRISFNEITKSAVKEAIKHPRDIDMNLVNSQQARRILDRLVGYKLSPFLWKTVKSGLSAGRVQSVATRIVVDREEEIRAFEKTEYWTIKALLHSDGVQEIEAKFFGDRKGKIEVNTKDEAEKIVEAALSDAFKVIDIKRSVKNRKPQPPYITSTFQQDANRRFGLQSQYAMRIAQELYEGVNVGSGTRGLITYMRTDSLRISDDARNMAKDYIVSKYGEEYYPATPNVYKAKNNSQDAHEAIRPTDINVTPDIAKAHLSNDQYRIYKMIWERFIASQMKNAELDTVLYRLESGGYVFHCGGYVIRFAGFMASFGNENVSDIDESYGDDDEMKKGRLPKLNEGGTLFTDSVAPEQHFTQPPARYTEGTLTKALAEMGIGRPSTFTATIMTIINRGYVSREGKTLVPTQMGEITTNLMKKEFARFVDYSYTAGMEEELEEICRGNIDYIAVLHSFYDEFMSTLTEAEKHMDGKRVEIPKVETDLICEKCGARMIERMGRFGKFAACPNYPDCKNTKQLSSGKKEKEDDKKTADEILADTKCTICGGDMVLRKGRYGTFFACRKYPECKSTLPYQRDTGAICPKCGKRLMARQSKSKRTFYSCEGYPQCDFSCWDTPQKEKCPKCNGLLLKKNAKGKVYCFAKCGWEAM